MAIDIEIRFTGLCTFGPEQVDGTKFRSIMLVNARDDAKPSDPDQQAHVAAILVPFVNYVATGRDYDIRFDGTRAEFGSADMVGFLLKGEQLSLPGLQGSDVSLEPGPDSDAECPEEGDRYGFGWVSSLTRADGSAPTNDALAGKDKTLLLARLRIEKGLLSTDRFVEHPNGKIAKWVDLSSANPTKERALAEVVKVTGISVSGNQFQIHSDPFKGSPNDIELKGDSAGQAYIWFVNMPIEDIVSPDRTPGGPPKADAHFHHHYHLADKGSRNPKPATGICTPVASIAAEDQERKAAHGGAASNPKCPPSSFEV